MRSGVDYRGKEWEENLNKLSLDKDLTGKVFGKLTVLFRVQNDKQGCSQWLCQCECGNLTIVKGSSLRTGHTKSCGCAQRELVSEKLSRQFVPGEQINYWTVMYRADGYIGKGSYWHCRCRCGNEKDVNGEHLANGASASCGCLSRELVSVRKLIDLTGCKFGLLTVLRRSDKKVKGDVIWVCLCECGNTVEVSGHSLRRGSALSCGCLGMSNGEYHISNILKDNNINYIYNRTYFPDLVNDDGNPLRYDFILVTSENSPYRLIEFDGRQHDEPVGFFGGVEGLQKTQDNDAIKNQYALSHNISLVRIPYSKRDSMTLEDLLGDKYLIKGEM